MADRTRTATRRVAAGCGARRSPWRRRLVIMVKEPVAGRVKTRLAGDVGQAAALRTYRANLTALALRLARDPRWQTVFAVAPATAVASRAIPAGPLRIAQPGGDIANRMQHALASPLSGPPPPGPVVLIGSDILAITPEAIAAAFAELAHNDVVFGPALDGGFWLVGLRRAPRIIQAFPCPVRWSGATALTDCLRALTSHRIGFAATLRDTDTAADLRALAGAAGRVLPPRASSLSAPDGSIMP